MPTISPTCSASITTSPCSAWTWPAREDVADLPQVAELIERRQAELIASALDLSARLYAEKPKPFARRMRAYWTRLAQRLTSA